MSTVIIEDYYNSEHERISIQRINDGGFAGQFLLCIIDNNQSGTIAPHLLDVGTREWLRKQLDKLDEMDHRKTD